MGTALRKLKKGGGAKDDNGMPVKFKGRLTDKALNVYYGGAITVVPSAIIQAALTA